MDGAEPDLAPLAKSDNTNIKSSVDRKRMAFEFSKQQQKEQSQKLANLLSGTGVGPNTPTLSAGRSKTISQVKEEQKKTRRIEAQQNYEQLKKSVPRETGMIGEGIITGLTIAGPGALLSAPAKGTTIASKLIYASKQFAIGSSINATSQLIAQRGDFAEVDIADSFASGLSSLVTRSYNANIIVDATISSAVDLSSKKGLETVFDGKKGEIDFMIDFGTGITLGFIGKGTDAITNKALDSDKSRAVLKGLKPLVKRGVQEGLKFVESESFKALKERAEKMMKNDSIKFNE